MQRRMMCANFAQAVPNSDTTHCRIENSADHEKLIFGNQELCDNLSTPGVAMGQENGNRNPRSFSATSCACLFDLYRPQIRTQLAPRDAGLSLNRQHEFSGDAPLGSRE